MTTEPPGVASVAGGEDRFLERTLWRQLRSSADHDAFCTAWLALLCRSIPGCKAGVVIMGEPNLGPYTPVSMWPGQTVPAALSHTVELSLQQRDAALTRDGETHVAVPITVAEGIIGFVGITTGAGSVVGDPVFTLRWATGWLESLWYAERARDTDEFRANSLTAFELLGVVQEQSTFHGACQALATELATRLDCDQVCIGTRESGHSEIIAISHSAQFGQRMNLNQATAAAMDEALDQAAIVAVPIDDDGDYRVTQAHDALCNGHEVDAVLTILLQAGGDLIGAINLQRARHDRFDDGEIVLCDTIATLLGPVLLEKQLNDRHILLKNWAAFRQQLQRLFGSAYFGRKIFSVIAVVLVIFFSLFKTDYRVTSPARIEGLVQRSVVAPFDSYIARQYARAGEIVEEGELLAELDDEDLALERIRWSTRARQSTAEYDQALAEQRRADAKIIQTEIQQAEAQIALMDAQLNRTRLVAPFTGVIVFGDLSQSVGAAVARGQELFRIAPVDQQRVMLEIEDADIDEIKPGQLGELRLSSLPNLALAYRVELVTAVTEQAEGRNFFRVEASLLNIDSRLRPGMEGVSKTTIERRLLISNWTRDLFVWLRLLLWRWLP